jgi:hypothetical protein
MRAARLIAMPPADARAGCDNGAASQPCPPPEPPMLQKLIIILFLLAILYNLGAGLYYMLSDKGQSDRTVNALTRRIGLSVLLFVLLLLGMWAGVITPHGVGR